MLKTSQAQVIQQANNDIVQLRVAELSYLVTFFGSFGTQLALVASFCAALVSQVPGTVCLAWPTRHYKITYCCIKGLECDCSPFWTYIYWVSVSLCMASALYGLLSTVFITVFGNGMALRGPTGSLVSSCTDIPVLNVTLMLLVIGTCSRWHARRT
jgi:hypothetical protein